LSHLKQRKSKVCLNCGTIVAGRYCQNCGQENIEPHENFWHLLTHFVYDFFHFDGKFFNTVRYLLFKPGFLSKEYIKGRRASYLNPIQMYLFISAIFFLFFSFIFNIESEVQKSENVMQKPQTAAQILQGLEDSKAALEKGINQVKDTSQKFVRRQKLIERRQNQLKYINEDIATIKADSSKAQAIAERNKQTTYSNGIRYLSYAQYDSIQRILPAEERDNFIERAGMKEEFSLIGKYGNENVATKIVTEKFLHTFPQLFFVSLPLFALVLQLLYVRRKAFYYVNHLIFTLHLYCAMFLMMLVEVSVSTLSDMPHFAWVDWLMWLIAICMFVYSYKALHNFYGQKRWKTILKFILLNFTMFWVMICLLILFFLVSMFIAA
jgi:hypothetical protein